VLTKFSHLLLGLASLAGVAVCGTLLMKPRSEGSASVSRQAPTFLSQAVIDLGRVDQNKKLNATATVINHTQSALTVKAIAKSCSCVDLAIGNPNLAPGESTEINITWATGSKRGRVQDVLTMQFEVVGEPSKVTMETLAIRADVVPECELSTERLFFKSPGETHTINLQSPAGVAYTFLNVFCESKSVRVRIAADAKSIEVTFVGESLAGFNEATVLCETDAKASKWLRLNLSTVVGERR